MIPYLCAWQPLWLACKDPLTLLLSFFPLPHRATQAFKLFYHPVRATPRTTFVLFGVLSCSPHAPRPRLLDGAKPHPKYPTQHARVSLCLAWPIGRRVMVCAMHLIGPDVQHHCHGVCCVRARRHAKLWSRSWWASLLYCDSRPHHPNPPNSDVVSIQRIAGT